ncbi:MAG: glycosyltransferase family A protein [Dysgonomonas sp.]
MSIPTISVIMPVYNGEKYLKEAIESILNQTYSDFEFIIINDGSTDETEKIILSYNDPRIVYIKNEINIRLIKTLNKGIDLARGQYIARMDADDISFPERFQRQISIFETYEDVDLVNISVFYLSEDGHSYWKPNNIQMCNSEAVKHITVLQNQIIHPGIMIKASLLRQYKYRDNTDVEYIEDYDLWVRILADGHICYTLPYRLLYYRLLSTSITHQNRLLQSNRQKKIIRAHTDLPDFVIDAVLGHIPCINYSQLNEVDRYLKKYFEDIVNGGVYSEEMYSEFTLWRIFFMISISLKSLKKVRCINKISLLSFLILHIHWFQYSKIRKQLVEILFSKKYKY